MKDIITKAIKKLSPFLLLYFLLFIVGLCILKTFELKIVEVFDIGPPNYLADFIHKYYLKILSTISWFGTIIIFIAYYCYPKISAYLFNSISKRKIMEFFGFLSLASIGALLLLWPAFHNGFPLIFHDDTGDYIVGFFNIVRAVGYNFFVKILSLPLYHSLWTVCFIQALLTSCALIRVSSAFLPKTKKMVFISFGILILLVLVTDISKYTSWIMADVSTSWLFLGGLLFLTSYKWYDRYLSTALITISIFSHVSHALLSIACGVILFSFTFSFRNKFPIQWKDCQKLVLVIFLSVVSMMFLNFGIGGGFRIAYQGGGNFLLAKIDSKTKAISQVLEIYCPERKWQLCNYKHMFGNPEISSNYILWSRNSPLRTKEMLRDQSEQREIAMYAVKLFWPEILNMFFRDSWEQFRYFDSNDGLEYYEHENCRVYKNIKLKFPDHFESFLQARQQQGLGVKVRIFPLSEQIIYNISFIFMFFSLILFLLKRKYKLTLLLFSVFIFISFNAIICGSLAEITGRYQGRVRWLTIYCIFLSVCSFLSMHHSRRYHF